MRLTIAEATSTAEAALRVIGYPATDASRIAEHLLDCELRGLGFSGLARILSIAERLGGRPPATEVVVERETPVSARLRGGDAIGYLAAQRATEVLGEKAEAAGIAVVGLDGTWYTGMLSFFAEQLVERGLVCIIASNASPWVAPEGGTEARFGTNPFCIGFPGEDAPVIWDIGTSQIIHAQVVLAGRRGERLPPGVALDANGDPTDEPAAALGGALAAWGGHRGSGLALAVQLLGMLAGSPAQPGELRDFGFFAIALRPDLIADDGFAASVDGFADLMRGTRPVDAAQPVRMPFERSMAQRAEARARGWIEVDDAIVEAVRSLR
ncbi:Ldh family oxidoreductase [Agrococcus jenensis]|uniref:LDH2 family malate/lactate/ureidoglycolate dehydrogenase n=1 Tax=Agrococcus jenensis TaxID=46353 RepID=A0A3N2ARV1_9MICO|nr:Ldh family oxidoreductase [Agrococcus jenensis]ROR65777.1 LDH2 family malate/lactate/ureidoglycolate dehydrogenase [Agrococcus jenensis]